MDYEGVRFKYDDNQAISCAPLNRRLSRSLKIKLSFLAVALVMGVDYVAANSPDRDMDKAFFAAKAALFEHQDRGIRAINMMSSFSPDRREHFPPIKKYTLYVADEPVGAIPNQEDNLSAEEMERRFNQLQNNLVSVLYRMKGNPQPILIQEEGAGRHIATIVHKPSFVSRCWASVMNGLVRKLDQKLHARLWGSSPADDVAKRLPSNPANRERLYAALPHLQTGQ